MSYFSEVQWDQVMSLRSHSKSYFKSRTFTTISRCLFKKKKSYLPNLKKKLFVIMTDLAVLSSPGLARISCFDALYLFSGLHQSQGASWCLAHLLPCSHTSRTRAFLLPLKYRSPGKMLSISPESPCGTHSVPFLLANVTRTLCVIYN